MGRAVSPSKSRVRSSVWWDFFDAIPGDPDHGSCKRCAKPIKCSDGTTGMKRHVCSCSPKDYKRVMAQSAARAATNTLLLTWAATSFLPLTKFEDESFLKFCNSLNPSYEPPSRKEISGKMLQDMYNGTVDEIMQNLSDKDVSLTMDHYSDPSTGISLMGTTASWIDGFRRRSMVISVDPVWGSHNSMQVKEYIEELQNRYKFKKILLVTTDAASVMRKAKSNAGVESADCVSHIIHNCVIHAIDQWVEGYSLRSKVKSIATHFHHSPLSSNLLKRKQKKFGMKEVKLINSVRTRWASEFEMEKRIVENARPLKSVLKSIKKTQWVLSQEELKTSAFKAKCLSLFNEVSLQLSSSSSYMSEIIPYLAGLHNTLKSLKTNKPDHKLFLKLLLGEFYQRLKPLMENDINKAAVLLDPRFGYQPKMLKKTEWFEIEKQIIAKADNGSSVEPPIKKTKKIGILSSVLGNGKTTDTTPGTILSIQKELNSFKTLVMNDRPPADSDPLFFWNENNRKFPLLAKMAMKYFTMCPSSVDSERLFSRVSLILRNKLRSRISPQTTQMLVFIECYRKYKSGLDSIFGKPEGDDECESVADDAGSDKEDNDREMDDESDGEETESEDESDENITDEEGGADEQEMDVIED